MHNPKADTVAIAAEMLPKRPSQGLLLTQSAIIQVTTENMPIKTKVLVKYGTTVLVFASNSNSNVRDANRATLMCLKYPLSSAMPTAFKNASSQADPLNLFFIIYRTYKIDSLLSGGRIVIKIYSSSL